MTKLILPCLAVALLAATGGNAQAAAVTPTQDLLLGMVDANFDTQNSEITATIANSGGVAHAITWDETPANFSRVTQQKESFDGDFTGFDSFDLEFTAFTQDVGVKMFVQTGPGFSYHETAFTNVSVGGGAVLLSIDLTSVPDIDQIRQFGYQIFGPNPNPGPGDGPQGTSSVLVQPASGATMYNPVPEPTTAVLGLLAGLAWSAKRRR